MIINITSEAMNRMFLYAKHAKGEVSGYADLVIEDGGKFVTVTKVHPLLPQECSGGETDIDWDAFTNFLSKLTPEQARRVRVWWHSHADMSAFFSGTDTDTIESWGKQLANSVTPYLLAICVNKKKQYEARFDLFKPVHMYEKCELNVLEDAHNPLSISTKAEVDEFVREKAKYEPMKGGLDSLDTGNDHWVECEDGLYRPKHWFKEERRFFSHLPEEDKQAMKDFTEDPEYKKLSRKEKKSFWKSLSRAERS